MKLISVYILAAIVFSLLADWCDSVETGTRSFVGRVRLLTSSRGVLTALAVLSLLAYFALYALLLWSVANV